MSDLNLWVKRFLVLCFFSLGGNYLIAAQKFDSENIPLPEHPRPDFQRSIWINLNGPWRFRFDAENKGIVQKWFSNNINFPLTIIVPFSWGSKLSGVKDEADIGWYKRTINVPRSWHGQRVFLVVGACDWKTKAWLDGNLLGENRGGYTPFEFDLTPFVKLGSPQSLVLRVDDTPHKFKLEGKQGYGRAAGIWQTIYLEARPQVALKSIHFLPDIDKSLVHVKVMLDKSAPRGMEFQLQFKTKDLRNLKIIKKVPHGSQMIEFSVHLKDPHLWSLDDPYLYEVNAILRDKKGNEDRVSTYFGMRKISVVNLPGTKFPYIALNNKPIYLKMTLDQAYNPDGYYTFPSDKFMRDEILRTRRLGLNGQRIHVKIGIPRKLYWADRLGVLIMADVPNSWGHPDENMRHEIETALRGMIQRDYNHPAIFAWVNFNETWGLMTRDNEDDRVDEAEYTPETQKWVASLHRLIKKLDPTRLAEDNSPCNFDHVATDINSWHAYLAGYQWHDLLDKYCRNTYPGSRWNFIGGRTQANQPLLNSECGNVWGYKGSTGDVDWSWDYHIMMNEFRMHPKICGWIYTEHHDVINEWNGYYRYDRSSKYPGLSGIVPGMSLKDLHDVFYVATKGELCRKVKPGETVQVPLYASFMTDNVPSNKLLLKFSLYGWDNLGNQETYYFSEKIIPCSPWMNKELPPLKITMPDKPALLILSLVLKDMSGTILHHNFTTYFVTEGISPREETITTKDIKMRVIRFAPNTFTKAQWSQKQWEILGGLKVNGAGYGYFEYSINWPSDLNVENIEEANFRIEVSAKQLFAKDKINAGEQRGNFMLGKGTHEPSLNPNSYPMTDEARFPSEVRIRVADQVIGVYDLRDDPADHRGILSWFSQKRDGKLREAGSYGYLVRSVIPMNVLRKAAREGKIVVRLEVSDALPGGLAIYGERFGRYPLDPILIFVLKK